ncbi:hypothetical protein LAUMK4_04583 [Mycobacterium persicum]|uniref:Uncharacterized protein n=1 Tax=Mycobacterium persicum TaxID=1487726 RepID=A0AB38V0B7_9MYCO|nr:hypothetical protein LAUMK15_05422 [Mycobacterium persicum]VAZ86253.1 hypothetical protein LAUMK42_05097 [Mycobacterium persicum]VAZ99387.1 hypothetical protein LAUMK4_04583 [Mycobacterium persicum]
MVVVFEVLETACSGWEPPIVQGAATMWHLPSHVRAPDVGEQDVEVARMSRQMDHL